MNLCFTFLIIHYVGSDRCVMDEDQCWPRGRHSSWSNDGRDGGSPSPRRMHHSGSPSHKFKSTKPVWDVSVDMFLVYPKSE